MTRFQLQRGDQLNHMLTAFHLKCLEWFLPRVHTRILSCVSVGLTNVFEFTNHFFDLVQFISLDTQGRLYTADKLYCDRIT